VKLSRTSFGLSSGRSSLAGEALARRATGLSANVSLAAGLLRPGAFTAGLTAARGALEPGFAADFAAGFAAGFTASFAAGFAAGFAAAFTEGFAAPFAAGLPVEAWACLPAAFAVTALPADFAAREAGFAALSPAALDASFASD
jgi:hypothetical protein